MDPQVSPAPSRLRPLRAGLAMLLAGALAWLTTRWEAEDDWLGHDWILSWRLGWSVLLGVCLLVRARSGPGKGLQALLAVPLGICAIAPEAISIYLGSMIVYSLPGLILLCLLALLTTLALYRATRPRRP